MKRTISTTVLFVLLILTVVALVKIGQPASTSALSDNTSVIVEHNAQ